jgi:hypothetical protein
VGASRTTSPEPGGARASIEAGATDALAPLGSRSARHLALSPQHRGSRSTKKSRGVPRPAARWLVRTRRTPPGCSPTSVRRSGGGRSRARRRGGRRCRGRVRNRRHHNAGHVALDGELLLLARRPTRFARGLQLRRRDDALLGDQRLAGLVGLHSEVPELRRRVAERRAKESRVVPDDRGYLRLRRAKRNNTVLDARVRHVQGGEGVGQTPKSLDEARRRVTWCSRA